LVIGKERVLTMDYEFQLRLQAYLDGEVSEAKAREIAQRLAQDQEAVSLLAELRNTRQAVAGFETVLLLPESREFFWSKIDREIRRQEQPQPVRPRVPLWAQWSRFLMPAGAVAALLIAGLFVFSGTSRVRALETAKDDSGMFTYHDYDAGATLVWVSYPAENELAPSEAAGTLR